MINMNNIGGSNRLRYDGCAYEEELAQSVAPLSYSLYLGKFENCDKCRYNKYWIKTQRELIDTESDLRLQTRPQTHCDHLKYLPGCKNPDITRCMYNYMPECKSSCISTNNPRNPIIYAPEICPIVYNNIPKNTSAGYHLPNMHSKEYMPCANKIQS